MQARAEILNVTEVDDPFLGHNFPGDYGLLSGSQPTFTLSACSKRVDLYLAVDAPDSEEGERR